MSINPNLMHHRKCCICEIAPPNYKCMKCNLYYCHTHIDSIVYHIFDVERSTNQYEYYKCCQHCCSNCYTEMCNICGDINSNLDLILLNGVYLCKDH